jgi:chromosome transmission fidelity protein 4
MVEKITAFLDGNTFVKYNDHINKLIVGNSCGIIKIYDVSQPDLEPQSIDINENLTGLNYYQDKLLITNTGGNLELINWGKSANNQLIYRSELPLRDSLFINDGQRILVGGDDNKLIVIDYETKSTQTINLPDQLTNISYNNTGEILSISLSNGDLQIYSVINEVPNLIHTFKSILNQKIHTSLDIIDFQNEHNHELICSKSLWSKNGQYLITTNSEVIYIYDRSNWSVKPHLITIDLKIIDFILINDFMLFLCQDFTVKFYKIRKFNELTKINSIKIDIENNLLLNLTWNGDKLYIGTTSGYVYKLDDIKLENDSDSHPKTSSNELKSLFLDEAEESDNEEDDDEQDKQDGNDTDALLRDSDDEEPQTRATLVENGYLPHQEDDMIIDDDEDRVDTNAFEKGTSRKRHKSNGFSSKISIVEDIELKPYSPGSTPWSLDSNNSHTSINRRYLAMNSIGYSWCVKNMENSHQTITVSFFDRSVQKDYHFIDYYMYDLCSINEAGILLGSSGYNQKSKIDNGVIYYRNHESEQDSWERKIPLLKNEFITSISLTNSQSNDNNSNALIIVGTNFGYLRFYNIHGVCINIMKTSPIITIIASSISTVLVVNQVSCHVITFSIIDVNQNYKYLQQNSLLPIRQCQSNVNPLIKGIFFNEYSDPCIVPGHDDTLLVLQSWREPQNAKWIPILNCHHTITNDNTKKNWKCWPLGVYSDKLNCIILKHNNQYPSFPLPLPIEIDIKIPISGYQKVNKEEVDEGEGDNDRDKKSPEESFLQSITMGKLISDTLNDDTNEVDNDEIMTKINKYSTIFDKSLLQMFGESCKESKLNKAFSIAKMIRTDKALIAASKISERMQFISLATKIGKLREDLINLQED